MSEKKLSWQARNPWYQKQWARENREKIRNYSIKYRKANPEKVAARTLAWQRRNPERMKALRRKHYQKHRAKRIAYSRNYRATSPNYRRDKREQDRRCQIELREHYIRQCIQHNRAFPANAKITPEIIASARKRIQAKRSRKLLKLFYAASAIGKAA